MSEIIGDVEGIVYPEQCPDCLSDHIDYLGMDSLEAGEVQAWQCHECGHTWYVFGETEEDDGWWDESEMWHPTDEEPYEDSELDPDEIIHDDFGLHPLDR